MEERVRGRGEKKQKRQGIYMKRLVNFRIRGTRMKK